MKRSKADNDYESARTALIPEAERLADIDVRGKLGSYAKNWTCAFFGHMDRLAREAGLISW